MITTQPDLATDHAARAALKANPRAFLARHGHTIPNDTRIVVHEATRTDLHVVLPADWAEHLTGRADNPVTRVLRRAADDPAFKARMFADPAAVAREAGIGLPEGAHIHLYEQAPGVHHVVIPPVAQNGEMDDSDLEWVAGGKASWLEDLEKDFGIQAGEMLFKQLMKTMMDAASEDA